MARVLGRLTLWLFCFTFLTLVPSSSSLALSCLPTTIGQAYGHAHIVFTGTVNETAEPWAVIAVDQYYKGTGPANVTVKSDITWGPSLHSGETWLLFVTVGERNEWLLGLCSPSRLVNASGLPAEQVGLSAAEVEALGIGHEPDQAPPNAGGHSPLLTWAIVIIGVALIVWLIWLVRRKIKTADPNRAI